MAFNPTCKCIKAFDILEATTPGTCWVNGQEVVVKSNCVTVTCPTTGERVRVVRNKPVRPKRAMYSTWTETPNPDGSITMTATEHTVPAPEMTPSVEWWNQYHEIWHGETAKKHGFVFYEDGQQYPVRLRSKWYNEEHPTIF